MINELTLLCSKMGIDIWEVIEAAKTKPYGFMPFYPSPKCGGHCISLDPFYLSYKAKEYNFWARFIELAGEISMRESMLLTKYVDLVIAPDTGILHASGCYDTPKIGLLGHTTKENITKYFKNDYSIEATCACAPCFYLIYDHAVQCPIERVTSAAWCMAEGIKPEVLFNKIKEVLSVNNKSS